MGDFPRIVVRSDGWIRARSAVRIAAAVLTAVAGLWLAAGAGLYAQTPGAAPVAKTMLMEPPPPLLPATLGKLKRVAEGDSGDGLGVVDAADATVLAEDGLRRFARSEYIDGSQRGIVTVYKFMDASGAISAYDYFKKPGMRVEKLGDNAVSNGNELLMRSGVSVVRANLNLHHDSVSVLMGELIDHLPKAVGTAGLSPLLPTLLPATGLDAESVKYALGPTGYRAMGGVLPPQVVGFDKSAEAVTAKYKGGGVLTLLLYPTPQIAGEHGRAVEESMKQPGATAEEGGGAAGTVKIRREGTLVLLTTGAWTLAEAQKMVDGIHLRSEVSFDKPMPLEFHAEVRKTYSLLTSIAIFCGFSALAMMVLGLFFGGGRALIRVMQGKSAASEPEFLRIDLRGTGGKGLRRPKA